MIRAAAAESARAQPLGERRQDPRTASARALARTGIVALYPHIGPAK